MNTSSSYEIVSLLFPVKKKLPELDLHDPVELPLPVAFTGRDTLIFGAAVAASKISEGGPSGVTDIEGD